MIRFALKLVLVLHAVPKLTRMGINLVRMTRAGLKLKQLGYEVKHGQLYTKQAVKGGKYLFRYVHYKHEFKRDANRLTPLTLFSVDGRRGLFG